MEVEIWSDAVCIFLPRDSIREHFLDKDLFQTIGGSSDGGNQKGGSTEDGGNPPGGGGPPRFP